MLTADLVRARKKAGELVLVAVDDRTRDEAVVLAASYLGVAQSLVGAARDEVDEALGAVEVRPALRKLADGLRKLVHDRCAFEQAVDVPPDELRREVFRCAVEARRRLRPGEAFDRSAVLAEVAAARGLAPDEVERGLFADLRAAHKLLAVEATTPETLLAEYETSQAQAVLLRAVRVTVDVACPSPAGYRALFGKLKFLRLLHAITPLESGYRIDIDGPFSMFEAVTKYGLQLAMCLPALSDCARFRLKADIRWGKDREPLVFRLEGGSGASSPAAGAGPSPEVEALLTAFAALESPWRASATPAILHLPGAGLCVPDVLFEHRPTGRRVYFEVMGFWSREAVWKRVDLVRAGLRETLLLAVSERLRVSEDVLGNDEDGALYVYKGTMSPRLILKKLDALAGLAGAPVSPLAPDAPGPAAKERRGAARGSGTKTA